MLCGRLKRLEFKVHTRVHGRPVNTPAATLNGLIQRAVGNLRPLSFSIMGLPALYGNAPRAARWPPAEVARGV